MEFGKVSVVMPAFNEASRIVSNVAETVRTLDELGYEFEVLVVDDGSPDRTHLEALKAKALFPERVRVVRYDRNKGKGNALSAGVYHSRGEYIVFLDADMDLHPNQIPVLFASLIEHDADGVVGSKFHPASNVQYPANRRVLSLGYYLLIRALFGLPLRDTQTGLKLFRRRLLEAALPFTCSSRFAFDIELLAIMHLIGAKFVDAPVTLVFQRSIGRINLREAARMLTDTLAIFGRLTLGSRMIRHVALAVRLQEVGKEYGLALLYDGERLLAPAQSGHHPARGEHERTLGAIPSCALKSVAGG